MSTFSHIANPFELCKCSFHKAGVVCVGVTVYIFMAVCKGICLLHVCVDAEIHVMKKDQIKKNAFVVR